MNAIRVNIDYESELFNGNGSGPKFNQNLEFFGFFLDPRPVYTEKKYTEEYLAHVESITGSRPETIHSGKFENWWGRLQNRELEKKLNSKLTTTELIIREGWCEETHILRSVEELPALDENKRYILKSPNEMSGRGFKMIDSTKKEEYKIWLEKALINSPLIFEPLFDRKWDFSHYVFPDGKIICYENLVDDKFQYKGSVFSDLQNLTLKNLSFYEKVSKSEWDKFIKQLEVIVSQFKTQNINSGFSIDSFVYLEAGNYKIRTLSEVNYRRTMGCTAYELSAKYLSQFNWTSLLITKSSGDFSQLKNNFSAFKNVLILSPGDTRFELFLIGAQDSVEGNQVIEKIQTIV